MTQTATPDTVIASTKGRVFRVDFIKRTDGSLRHMVARTGVRKGVKGVGLGFDPAARGLAVVYDMVQHAHRMVNLEGVVYIKCGATEWRSETNQRDKP